MKKKAYRDAFVSGQISSTIAAQIAMLREERGWTQKQLADKAAMKQPRISALEDPNCENFEIETARRLASAFDVGLIVRFAPFSEIAEWSANVSDEKLLVPSFIDDEILRPADTWTTSTTGISILTNLPVPTTAARASVQSLAVQVAAKNLHLDAVALI